MVPRSSRNRTQSTHTESLEGVHGNPIFYWNACSSAHRTPSEETIMTSFCFGDTHMPIFFSIVVR
jgi:hypothetical protein